MKCRFRWDQHKSTQAMLTATRLIVIVKNKRVTAKLLLDIHYVQSIGQIGIMTWGWQEMNNEPLSHKCQPAGDAGGKVSWSPKVGEINLLDNIIVCFKPVLIHLVETFQRKSENSDLSQDRQSSLGVILWGILWQSIQQLLKYCISFRTNVMNRLTNRTALPFLELHH